MEEDCYGIFKGFDKSISNELVYLNKLQIIESKKENSKNKKKLEEIFKSPKIKVHLNNAEILGKGKIYGTSGNKFIIYDNKTFTKLFEIEFENINNIQSVIELDNHDLIFFMINKKKKKQDENFNFYLEEYDFNDFELIIYRLKDNNYSILQKIKEERKGYKLQFESSGCLEYTKTFSLKKIKKLSENRFMSISNYGIRLYSLNNSNLYSLVLMESDLSGDIIHEINKNEFIICINNHFEETMSLGAFDYLLVKKISIENFDKNKLNKKIEEFNENENESNEILSSLKLTCSCKTLFEYSTYEEVHKFSNYIILKNKLFMILVDNHLLIFNLIDNKLIKRYTIIDDKKNNDEDIDIKKWSDNEFFITKDGRIYLFELNENNLKIKIIDCYDFDKASSIKIDEDNRFYIKESIKDLGKKNVFISLSKSDHEYSTSSTVLMLY